LKERKKVIKEGKGRRKNERKKRQKSLACSKVGWMKRREK
jgi:hypothetical protein